MTKVGFDVREIPFLSFLFPVLSHEVLVYVSYAHTLFMMHTLVILRTFSSFKTSSHSHFPYIVSLSQLQLLISNIDFIFHLV